MNPTRKKAFFLLSVWAPKMMARALLQRGCLLAHHDTRNECFSRLSRSLRTRRSLAGKILNCMPAGDSKNEPHQEEKPSFFFQWDNTTIKKEQNNRHQGKKKKKQQSKSVFSFPPEEREPFSFFQPRKDDGARRCGEGAFSVPQCVCDVKTQHSKVCCHGSFFIFISEPN